MRRCRRRGRRPSRRRVRVEVGDRDEDESETRSSTRSADRVLDGYGAPSGTRCTLPGTPPGYTTATGVMAEHVCAVDGAHPSRHETCLWSGPGLGLGLWPSAFGRSGSKLGLRLTELRSRQPTKGHGPLVDLAVWTRDEVNRTPSYTISSRSTEYKDRRSEDGVRGPRSG